MGDFSEGCPPCNLPHIRACKEAGNGPVSWSGLCPWASPVGMIVPAWVGRAMAPWARIGITAVPLWGASGQKEAGRWK